MDEINLKKELYELCREFILGRIETAETALEQSREASNDDTKSSAGDKFETTREMMAQDIGRTKGLLADAQQNLKVLESIIDVSIGERVRNGNLVYTNQGIFYISISAGSLSSGKSQAFAISALSPVGKMMVGKKVGESFTFNQKEYQITAIF
ncbi:GreA/GreB family elongation factor [Pedobacter duraquae]|uniref:GreA/GreB family transcription elongation factor n=1 Tax=Pedobacter duraquae TaxID=425511 RepID=A0A4R6IQN2_9SPHI|nr:GreA/GreB family elongation factor [Pedobacter duraquae]TDO24684.1 GreA/GreB family transcription elongation factor [Pedobacter duraquae]